MISPPKQEPFRAVDVPDREIVLAWGNVTPLPNRGLATAAGDPVEQIAFVVYQLKRGEKL